MLSPVLTDHSVAVATAPKPPHGNGDASPASSSSSNIGSRTPETSPAGGSCCEVRAGGATATVSEPPEPSKRCSGGGRGEGLWAP
mmetsp:Transcript_72644/g.136986  ORF Transcript_72644/g.136986 Transcript_72644/m.136986 type:complete len:85 (+) Transcript_72644:254-508(+)